MNETNTKTVTDESSRSRQAAMRADASRVAELFSEHQQDICKRTDHMFAVLMTLQWLAGIVAAYCDFTKGLDRFHQPNPRTCLGGAVPGRRHQLAADFLGCHPAGPPLQPVTLSPSARCCLAPC